MHQSNLFKQLKFRYQLLTNLIAMCCALPAIMGMFPWIPVIERIESNYSKDI